MTQKSKTRFVFLTAVTCFLLMASASILRAQNTGKIVSGTVKDATEQTPLEGVTVMNKTTNQSSGTDALGTFTISGKQGDVLKFTMLGFLDKEQVIGSEETLEIWMTPENQSIGEVVVTALGIKRETRGLTYSTQQLSGSAVNDVRDNSGNMMSSLAGKVAGATVTTASTGPGGAVRMVLRGNKSLSGNNNALVVVDGVPFDNSPGRQATGTSAGYGNSDGAANINSEDIESINILKGASATALYGSRAANGAVIITTKQGRAGRYQIDYHGSASVEAVNMLPKFQNTYGRGSGGVTGTNVGESWGEKVETVSDNVKSIFRNAPTISNSISTYGGSEKVNGYMSYSNNNVGGILPHNKMDRNSLNLRLNTELIPNLKTDVKLNYINQNIKNRPRLGDVGVPVEAYIMPRDLTLEELGDFETINPANGEPMRKYWSGSTIYNNPYWWINRTSVNEARDRITALGSVTYDINEGLSVLGRYSFDKYIDLIDGSFYEGIADIRDGGMYYETHSRYWEHNFDFLINGNNSLSDVVDLSYNVGTSFLSRNYNTLQNMANGLSIPNKFSFAMATTPEFLLVDGYKRQLNSLYASAQLALYNNIFLDLTARNDWSSTLKKPHSYFYPSIGLGVVFNEWLQMPTWVDFGKLRASLTKVGNDAQPYLLEQLYQFGLGAGKGFVSRSQIKAIPDLKPEITNSFEVGLDMKFFENRLSFDATYYKTNTVNQLMYIALPMASGFSREYINSGNIENRGFELQLSATPIAQEKFNWSTDLNFSTNTNKVLELHEKTKRANVTDNTKYATVVINEGGEYGDLYGHKWKVDATSGRYIVNDKGLPVVESNQKLGNFNPKALLGWSNNFSYKNFTLNTLVDARIGGEIVSGTAAYMASFGVGDFTETHREGNWVLDAVKEDGSENTTAISAQDFWQTVSQGGRDAWGEFFTYDMTNIRMRELSLSYRFDVESIKGLQAAQVSLTGRNLFFFYRGKSKLHIPGVGKINSPIDPEGALGAGNYQGVEVGLPPAVRTFGMSVKLTF